MAADHATMPMVGLGRPGTHTRVYSALVCVGSLLITLVGHLLQVQPSWVREWLKIIREAMQVARDVLDAMRRYDGGSSSPSV